MRLTRATTACTAGILWPTFPRRRRFESLDGREEDPGKLAYATPGSGTAMHLGMEMLKVAAGVDIVHVPYYKGGAPATQDVMGGRVPILMDVHYSAAPHIKSGKLKAIALLSLSRPASAPEIPLVTETVPGVAAISLVGHVVPAATPRDVVRKASADIARAVRDTDLRERMVQQGMQPVGSSPEEFDAMIRAEIAKWAPAENPTAPNRRVSIPCC